MKINTISIAISLLFTSVSVSTFAQPGIISVATSGKADRVSFMLKNTLGYHRMFRVEGPGIAYGFTMSKRETVPCNWPIDSKLYFSTDGETTNGLILTVKADDAGKTLTTGDASVDKTRGTKPAPEVISNKVTFMLHSTSLLPRKIALISYEPGESGNGTTIFTLAMRGSKRFSFPVGTKLYIIWLYPRLAVCYSAVGQGIPRREAVR